MAWLRLLRISGVATVWSNAIASCVFLTYADSTGWQLLAEKLYRNGPQALWVLLTSALLYLSGMLWNDLLDVDRDRDLHPARPLPSGAVALPSAFAVGCLLAVGSLLAALQLGYRGFHAAGIVLTLTFLYNAGAKQVPLLGALTMALVRGSHAIFALLMLGPGLFDRVVLSMVWPFQAGDPSTAGMSPLVPLYPLLLAAWIFGTTWISELESRAGRRLDLLGAGLFLLIPLVAVPVQLFDAAWLMEALETHRLVPAILGVCWVMLLLSLVGWRTLSPWWQAVRDLERERMGPLTGRLLGSLILLDAALVAARHPLYALPLLGLATVFALARLVARMD